MKRHIIFIIAILLFFSACSKSNKSLEGFQPRVRDYTSFTEKPLAVIEGTLAVTTADSLGAISVSFKDTRKAIEHVRLGNVWGFIHSTTMLSQYIAKQDNDDFTLVIIPHDIYSAQIAAIGYDQKTIDSFNNYLTRIHRNRTYSILQQKWFSDEYEPREQVLFPEIKGKNGFLEVAICSDSAPFCFIGSNGVYTGFNIDIIIGYAVFEDKILQFIDLDFKDLIDYVASTKADIGMANIEITDERKEKILFSEPYFHDTQSILILR